MIAATMRMLGSSAYVSAAGRGCNHTECGLDRRVRGGAVTTLSVGWIGGLGEGLGGGLDIFPFHYDTATALEIRLSEGLVGRLEG